MHPKELPGALPISDYKDPTMTLPVLPPPRCTGCNLDRCDSCRKTKSWWQSFKKTVDDLVLKSNVHRCTVSRGAEAIADPELPDSGDPSSSKAKRVSNKGPKGCLDSQGNCWARFPREQHETMHVDPADGHVNMKKRQYFLFLHRFRRNPQELTGIPEFRRNPSEWAGIRRNGLELQ